MRLTYVENLANFKRVVMDKFDEGYNYCLDELQIIAPEHTTYVETKELQTDNGIEYDTFCHKCQGFIDPEANKDFKFCPYCGGLIQDQATYLYINKGIKITTEEE